MYPSEMNDEQIFTLYQLAFDDFHEGRRNSDVVNWFLSRQLTGEPNRNDFIEAVINAGFDYMYDFDNEAIEMFERTICYCVENYQGLPLDEVKNKLVEVEYDI